MISSILKDPEDISEETREFGEAQDGKLEGWQRVLGVEEHWGKYRCSGVWGELEFGGSGGSQHGFLNSLRDSLQLLEGWGHVWVLRVLE